VRRRRAAQVSTARADALDLGGGAPGDAPAGKAKGKAKGGGKKGKGGKGGDAAARSATTVSSGVKLEDISVTFKNQQLLRGVSWDVKRGERVGLVGARAAAYPRQRCRSTCGRLRACTRVRVMCHMRRACDPGGAWHVSAATASPLRSGLAAGRGCAGSRVSKSPLVGKAPHFVGGAVAYVWNWCESEVRSLAAHPRLTAPGVRGHPGRHQRRGEDDAAADHRGQPAADLRPAGQGEAQHAHRVPYAGV